MSLTRLASSGSFRVTSARRCIASLRGFRRLAVVMIALIAVGTFSLCMAVHTAEVPIREMERLRMLAEGVCSRMPWTSEMISAAVLSLTVGTSSNRRLANCNKRLIFDRFLASALGMDGSIGAIGADIVKDAKKKR